MAETAAGTAPAARRGASLTLLPRCANATATFPCMVLVGGTGRAFQALTATQAVADNVWVLLLNPLRWVSQATLPGASSPAPAGLFGHNAVATADGEGLIIYGGATLALGVSSDTYELSPFGYYDAAVQASEMTNVALNKPTAGSSAASSFYEPVGNLTGALDLNTRVVVDGSITQAYGAFRTIAAGVGTCFVTYVNLTASPQVLGTTNPWWRVDLGSVTSIWQLRFWMRADGILAASNQPGPLANTGLSFWLSNTAGPLFPWQGNGVQIPNPIPNPIYAPNIITLSAATSGRYVWVAQIGALRVLQLCQLQVLQPTPWTWRKLSGQVNLALNKYALQAAVNSGFAYGDPLNVNDGILSNSARTPNNVPNVWIMVDLGATYRVDYMTILDGAGSNWARSNATELVIGDNADPFAGPNKQCFGPAPITCFSFSTTLPGNAAPYGADGWYNSELCTSGGGPVRPPSCSGEGRYIFIRKRDSNAAAPNGMWVPGYNFFDQCKFGTSFAAHPGCGVCQAAFQKGHAASRDPKPCGQCAAVTQTACTTAPYAQWGGQNIADGRLLHISEIR